MRVEEKTGEGNSLDSLERRRLWGRRAGWQVPGGGKNKKVERG